jgi:NAD(P)-dependent dehydrogenase (short-subunit alcohol dehydrogenase family)
MRLNDKVAIVTGAGRGIGRAIAERFGAEGATVYAADIAPGSYEADGVRHVELDVADLERWVSVVSAITGEHGKVDVLVNDAAIVTDFAPLADVDPDGWDQMMRVNLTGAFYGMRSVIPSMVERGGGSIVNIASTAGISGTRGMTAYSATKGGLRTLTRNAAVTYAAQGIRCNAVVPGVIDTEMLASAGPEALEAVLAVTPISRPGKPEEIASGVLYLASDEASYVTGMELVIDGGFLAL